MTMRWKTGSTACWRTPIPAALAVGMGLVCCVLLLGPMTGRAMAAGTRTAMSSPSASYQTPASDLAACLPGHWMHAHEEDTAGVQVYRSADFAFPPARGRTGFELLVGGELIAHGIAPADGPLLSPGLWRFIPPDLLQIEIAEPEPDAMTWQIVSCDVEMLRLATAH